MNIRLIALALSFLGMNAALANSTEKSPRFLVHLLDYLAKDYGGAVSHGKITSATEYQEQVEFVASALETVSVLSQTKHFPEIHSKVSKLKQLINDKEEAEAVSRLAREIQSQVIEVTKLQMAPVEWPNLRKGRELFSQNCISCHGNSGYGDGPAGKALDPKPANFHDLEAMHGTSPFQEFNTIRLGVPGTGMAAFDTLSDQEVWDLAFYVVSLRHEAKIHKMDRPWQRLSVSFDEKTLAQVATLSDEKLEKLFLNEDKNETIAILRTHSGDSGSGGSLSLARTHLENAVRIYEAGDTDSAKTLALKAYLEGIEPIEPRLRANDSEAVIEIETVMAHVRSSIEGKKTPSQVRDAVDAALSQISRIEKLLQEKKMSPWLTFTAAFAILLREGFEAILIIVALLGVIKASGANKAARWVHGGWVFALGLGAIAWFFSGWLMGISGASREVMEGLTSLFAVFVLLVVGFWLHSQTEIGRWRAFIEGKIKRALEGRNLFALATISFVGVFREAFETVLFLRAVWIEGGAASKAAMGAGTFSALALIFVLAWLILKYSARFPIRKLFTFSSTLMVILALILTGKGFHSLQESGFLPITSSPMNLRVDLLGLYPTVETLVSQVVVLFVVCALWIYGNQPSIERKRVRN